MDKFDHKVNLLNCSIPEAITVSLDCLKTNRRPFGAYANGFTSIDALEIGGTVDVLKSRQDLGPEEYFQQVMVWIKAGAKIIGGCCEISPKHIKYIYEKLNELNYQIVSSL